MAQRLVARRAGGLILGILGVAATALAVWAVKDMPAAMGGTPAQGSRGERIRRSPQFRGGQFRNSVPSRPSPPGTGAAIIGQLLAGGERRRPRGPIPLVRSQPDRSGPPAVARTATADPLHLTWYGHASTLVEIEGSRILFDPVWSDRVSPSRLVGPSRLHPPPLPLGDLPRIDAVVVSHDHYDHLDMATIKALAAGGSTVFVVPIGVGAHLERWGIGVDRIIELDWSESTTVDGIRVTLTAARHFSGRGLARDPTLWGSWVLAGRRRRVFYTGDTGYFDGFARIGEEYGPFDATLVQIGAYNENWPDIHMTPEDGLTTHLDVRGTLLVPVHWCTYVLAFHDWAEPVDRLWQAAKDRGATIAVPRPGERIDVDNPPEVDPWWQTVA